MGKKARDLTGLKFNMLTVIRKAETQSNEGPDWLCMCECGKEKVLHGKVLTRKASQKSCGCLRSGGLYGNAVNLAGRRFGRIVVIFEASREKKYGRRRWFCRCDCGVEKVVEQAALVRGHVVSCGCYSRDMASARGTHRESLNGQSKEYRSWAYMKTRCYNKNRADYKYYGGRGIEVCERWKNSFENFLEDMGRCPEGLTLDRENCDGNYSPLNCRWATWETQHKNTRRSIWIEHGGKRMIQTDWARELGIKPETWNYHKQKNGYTGEETLNYFLGTGD